MAKNLIRMLCEVFCQRLRTFFSHEVPREEIFPYLTSVYLISVFLNVNSAVAFHQYLKLRFISTPMFILPAEYGQFVLQLFG